MLALLGLITIVVLLAAILSRKLTPLTALIAVPVVTALIGGFGLETGSFIVAGIRNVAPIAGMFIFAILFFGIVSDAGMFDPIIQRILNAVGKSPPRIVLGTALLAAVVHLDGSGAVTFLVAIPAVLPLYRRLNMDRRVLACAVAMAAGVNNLLPWGGPTIRAAAALQTPVTEIFNPLIPVQLTGLCFVFAVAWWLGKREERRLQAIHVKETGGNAEVDPASGSGAMVRELSDAEKMLRRPHMFWPNALLTLLLVGAMISGKIAPVVVFMLGTVIALVLNYPHPKMQRERVDAHARAALMMAGVLLAAGAFTGIMKESGMLTAMAGAAVSHLPVEHSRHIPFVMGLVSMPMSLLFDPDSFYFGILPVVAEAAGHMGVPSVQVAQGALMGQMTTGFPISPLTPATFLLVGLADIDLAEHQKFAAPFLFATSVVMTLAAVLFGVFPI
ncbi:MAG TPA: citrate:proton symporter [Verrucomicrobiae bacterium]|nr:citrate:proton symporter [Verrucomicrobiae bacterium]